MKCSVCGKEFGEGVNCRNCGVDRVTGLANYNGYGTSDHHGTNTSHYDSSYNSSPKTMVCYACSEIIPSDSEYCPHCRKKLYKICPKCGNKYSSQYLNCNQCGTNRKEYYEQKEKERRAELERQKTEQENRAIQIEAIKLQDQLKASESSLQKCSGYILFLAIAMSIILLLVSCFFEDYFFKEHFLLKLSILGVIILFFITGGIIGDIGNKIEEKRTQHNVSQWKREHPNDPRSKYL